MFAIAAIVILLLALALCFIGPIQALQETKPLGGQAAYRALFPFYQAMQNVCGPNPGVLLAHPDEGHYLRYYTNCRIVANNLLANVSRDTAAKIFMGGAHLHNFGDEHFEKAAIATAMLEE